MSHKHVTLSDVGLTPRSVTRRDALRLFIGAGICATFLPAVAGATSTQEKLDAAQLSYDQAQAELDAIGEQIGVIAGQLATTQGEVGDLEQQINQKQGEIDQTQSEIEQKQSDIESKQEQLGERMSSAYKSGTQSTIDLLLSSTTFEELTSNIYYLDKISTSDREMIDEVKGLKEQLETQKADLENQKADLEGQKADLEVLLASQQDQLAQQQAAQQEAVDLVNGLSDEVKELMAQRDAELLAAQQAAEELRRQQEEEAARRQQQAQQNSQSTNSSSSNSGSNSSSNSGSNSSSGSWSGGGGNTTVNGTGSLSAVTNATYSTPSPGSGLCAAWVTNVFTRAGVGTFYGNACDMYSMWCGYATSNIQAGMIVATPSAPYGAAAMQYGHVGIYIGGGTVRHNQSGVVKSDSLSSWISMYSKTATVRCGWLGGIALS